MDTATPMIGFVSSDEEREELWEALRKAIRLPACTEFEGNVTLEFWRIGKGTSSKDWSSEEYKHRMQLVTDMVKGTGFDFVYVGITQFVEMRRKRQIWKAYVCVTAKPA